MIKNKLSDLISTQLPDHIRDSYPTFVEFLKAYYKFLEDEQKVYRNLESIRDVDDDIHKSLDVFIDRLKKEFAVDFPEFSKTPQFLKNTPHISVAHGSEESYKFLFRQMFQKEVDIRYPREQLLTISDSKWVQDFSIFVKLTSGDIASLQNNTVFLNTKVNGISTKNRIYVKRVESVLTSESIYELFINKDVYGKVLFGDIINQDGVVASVVNTTTSIKIKKAGFGFKVGQVFNIESDVGTGLTFKVTEVTALGGIKSTQIINYGINYKSTFSFDLPSTFISNDVVETTLGTPIKINAYSSVQRYIDSGIVSKQNYYTSDYSTDYVGEVMTSFNSVTVAEEITANSAQLEVVLGTVAKYQGYYENSTGLVSSPDSVIQDNNYYQKYSYVLRIDEALSSYRETVISLLHPIGRKLFAEYVVDNIFELDYEVVEPVFRILLPLFAGVPTVVNMLTELSMVIAKPVSSVQLVEADSLYLFQKPTTTVLTSFDDPTLLDVISGAVKGSVKTYLFDSAKGSSVTPGSDDYWLFEQSLASSTPPTTEIVFLVAKDSQSEQVVSSSSVYLFDSPKESILSTPGSDEYWLFDSDKGSSVTPESDEYWLFEQPLSSSTPPTTQLVFLAENVLESSQSLSSSSVYLFDSAKESILSTPESDEYWLFDSAKESILPQQSFLLSYDMSQILNTSLADQSFVAAITTERPAESFIDTPTSQMSAETGKFLDSSISSPTSAITDIVVGLGPDSPVIMSSPAPILETGLVQNSSLLPLSSTAINNSILLTTNTDTFGSATTYVLEPSYASDVSLAFTLEFLRGTLLESSVATTSSPSLDFAPPILISPVFTTDDDTLLVDNSISSSTINSDSGNVFFNQYNDTFSYFADETYLARTRTF